MTGSSETMRLAAKALREPSLAVLIGPTAAPLADWLEYEADSGHTLSGLHMSATQRTSWMCRCATAITVPTSHGPPTCPRQQRALQVAEAVLAELT